MKSMRKATQENSTGEDFTLLLRQKKCKVTETRVIILQTLATSPVPLSTKEITARIHRTKNIDRVTVHRGLELFKKLGIIHQTDFQTDCAYFELSDGTDHHHIICLHCRKIEDFVGCHYKQLITNALKQTSQFEKVVSHSLELFGVCTTCAQS